MKIIIHLFFNESCTEISSSEIQIESNEILVKEFKKRLSEIFHFDPSEQILTTKFSGLKIITLSDEYPLSFFYLRENSEIYLDKISKYKNKTPSEIIKMNSQYRKLSTKTIQKSNKNINKYMPNILESIEESNDNEIEIEKLKNNYKNKNNIMIQIKEINPKFIIRNALHMIKDDNFIQFINYLESNKTILGFVQKIKNNKNNWNALHYSCYYGNKDITAFLLSYNNKYNSVHELINSLTNENLTPLHLACYKCNDSIVKILLLYLRDIDINMVNKKKETPLHIACKKNSLKIVSMLIASKANLFLRDKNNKKPIELTTDNNIKKLLIKSMIKSPNFKNENLYNINLDIFVFKNNYFTPPKPPKIIGFVEKRGQIIPFYKTIFVEIDPIMGHLKKFKDYNNYPNNHYDMIMLNNINLCKKEYSDSNEDFYFSINFQKNEIYKVKNKKSRDRWIQCINESVVYYRYWKKFQKKNQNIKDYLKLQNNNIEFIDFKSGEIRKLDNNEKKNYKSKINIENDINNKKIHISDNIIKKEDDFILKNSKNYNIDKNKENNELNIKTMKNENINSLKKEKLFNVNKNHTNKKGIKFHDYIIISLIGVGSFGRVFKVKLKDEPIEKFYAMKVINKNLLIRKKQLKYAVNECSVLKKCNCPFIVNLYYSFQTLENLYMIEEYCPGGDLHNHLKLNLIEEDDAKILVGELILAIEHLHNLNIIYRDLKPENILIGKDNHIVLADFGLAKERMEGKDLNSSFCGTPAYLPPESLNLKGVGKSGDIYGIGAVLYEMISGTPPFFSNEIETLFKKIRNCQLILHHYFSEELKDLLKQLLEKDPNKRLGVFDKEELKNHPFFKGIIWDKLKNKEINSSIDFLRQKNEIDKLDIDKENKRRNAKFIDEDYTEENQFSKRVKNFTFIRIKDINDCVG